jgi:hypothetical protein
MGCSVCLVHKNFPALVALAFRQERTGADSNGQYRFFWKIARTLHDRGLQAMDEGSKHLPIANLLDARTLRQEAKLALPSVHVLRPGATPLGGPRSPSQSCTV